MPTPVSGQPISLYDIQTEFGGSNLIGLGEYYQNAEISYTSGVTGIPNTGALISLGMFHGKSKPVAPPSSYPPAAVVSIQITFGAPWAFSGFANSEWLTGASGTNLTRTGGSTFNNIGAYAAQRTPFINNQSLILQAKPGDALRFVIQNGAAGATYSEVNSLLLNLSATGGNAGWFLVQSIKANGGHTDTINYTLSASLAPGSYGIFAYNNYSFANNPSWSSGNFYSLHVVS
jgi:hypothetical protein